MTRPGSGPSPPPAAWLGTCRRCGKRTYDSKMQAKRAARVLYPGTKMRSYRCGEGWHITSQGARAAAKWRAALSLKGR